MNYIQAIITGIIQGLTEFLPISSSAHLVLTAEIFEKVFHFPHIVDSEELFFDLMLHLGTLVAVVVYFRVELCDIFRAFFKALKTKNFAEDKNSKLFIFIFLSTFTSICLAFPFRDLLEKIFQRPDLVGFFLLGTASLLTFTEFYSEHHAKDSTISVKKAVFIGLFQGLAMIFRGISRSGSTIAAGLISGLSRIEAAKYSFLLSVPIIFLAVIFHSSELILSGQMVCFSMGPILVGTVVSAIVGYLCIKYFLIFLQKHTLHYFAVYCAIIGITAIILF